MRILITGGAGFLGSHLCDLFHNRGDEVVCVDSLITGREVNVAHLVGSPRFTLVNHNVSQPIPWQTPVDWVLHFASPASPVDYHRHPIETLHVGAWGTQNALDLARKHKARFLLASTSEVYGTPEVSPQPESYWGHVNPVGPRSVYDEAKRFAEALTMAHHRELGMSTRIVRIFNTYGPRMRRDDGRAIPAFLDQAMRGAPLTVFGDGSQTRSFCYVADLVAGIEALMRAAAHDPVNIGNPEEVTILELARRVIAATGSRSQIVFKPLPQDDPDRRQPDITRARTLLGWQPTVRLEDGLRRTIEWLRETPAIPGTAGR